MKIAILLSSLAQTGPGFVMRDLANELSKTETVYVITMSQSKEETGKITFSDRVSVSELDFPNGKVTSQMRKKIGEILSDFSIESVISNGIRSDTVIAGLKTDGMQKIAVSHNNPFEDYVNLYGFLKGGAMALMQMRAFRGFDKVVTLNPALRRLHGLFIGKQKVVMILNGVRSVDTRANTNSSLFGVVATFNKRKNQEFILKNTSQSTIILWGNGPTRFELMQNFSKKNIQFAGFSEDKEMIYSSFRVLVSSSISEGMPLNVLEAISAGKPLVLSDIAAHRFLTQFLPPNSYRLFNNQSEYEQAIAYFSDYQYEFEVVETKLKTVYEELFSVEVMASRYLSMLKG